MRPSRKRGAKIPNALLVACLLGVPSDSKASVPECSPEACQSAAASLDYLRRVMDQFHDRFPVYDDLGSAGNHFHARAKIPDEHAPVLILGGSTDQPHSGATATRNELIASSPSAFGGFFFLNGVLPAGHRAPLLNFGTYPNAGIDLTGATALTFWARGAKGGEQVDFFVGGVGRNPGTGLKEARYPDSNPSIHLRVRLTAQWLPYQIDLSGADLSYVLGGFGWAASVPQNPKGAVFFLDDIQFELSPAAREARLAQPRLLRSFETLPFQSLPAPVGDFDFVLRNSAHTYDNALALLAFLAQGTPDDLRRARLIGDAFVYASRHDRTHVDGRLRDVYAAGDIALPPGWTPNGKSGTVPIPGFFDEARQEYFEIDQGQLSAGNNAWVMLALLALYLRTGGEEYLDVARGLGEFLLPLQSQEGLYPGFLGGYKDPEGPRPMRQPWSSTEHNMDIHAAFSILYGIEGRPAWRAGANHARRFVESMWDPGRGCNLTGTIDPDHRNEGQGQLPSDAQSWNVPAVPGVLRLHPSLLECAERNHRTTDAGFSGFDFNEDRDGVWFEGTAHMAVALAMAGREAEAEVLRQELRRAQSTPPFGDGEGLAAASHDGVSSGFGFLLFRRLHVGATAWNVFAQLRLNPFTAAPIHVGPCAPGPAVLCLMNGRYRLEVEWKIPQGQGQGSPVPVSDQTGLFWFFDSSNIELIVKVLDGRPVNGNVWVFYGALSDVEYLLRVSDTATGAVRMYRNEPGNLCGRGDTTAFPEYYPDPSAAAYVLRPALAPPGLSAPAACSPGSNALCLLDGRFRVSVHWKNQHGGGVEGEGIAIPGTDQTGYFWFFDSTNIELVVKVLDGRPVDGKFWVFYGALSDVEYTLTVTDVETGAERVYVNTPGNLCGKGDTGAF
jgi:hypothetical protein